MPQLLLITMQPSTEKPLSRPGSTGLFVVGAIALTALVLAVYALLGRDEAGAEAVRRVHTVELKLSRLEAGSADAAQETREPAASDEKPRPAPGAVLPGTPGRKPAGGSGAFTVVPNPELKGRLGKLIVAFPESAAFEARTDVFPSGTEKSTEGGYGNYSVELPPGSYDLVISGASVPGVRIESGHETRVSVGLLRFNSSSDTRFDLFTPGGPRSFVGYYGQKDVGLPIGTFEIQVGGRREKFSITSGHVTQY